MALCGGGDGRIEGRGDLLSNEYTYKNANVSQCLLYGMTEHIFTQKLIMLKERETGNNIN